MLKGSCQCGEIHYESEAKPLGLYVCHCQECQKQSASAFGISLDIPSSGFRLTQGLPKYWNRVIESGKNLKCAFCSICGSRLWHEYDPDSGIVSIKGGSLDTPIDLSNATHVWVKRKLSGVIIPDNVPQFLDEP